MYDPSSLRPLCPLWFLFVATKQGKAKGKGDGEGRETLG